MLELRKFWNDNRFSEIKPRHVRDISRKTEFYHNTIKFFFFVKCIGHILVLSPNIYYYSKTFKEHANTIFLSIYLNMYKIWLSRMIWGYYLLLLLFPSPLPPTNKLTFGNTLVLHQQDDSQTNKTNSDGQFFNTANSHFFKTKRRP